MRDCVRVARGMRKRVAADSFVEQPDAKKRTVLHDLTNFEIEFGAESKKSDENKIKRKMVAEDEVDVDANSDDPQMCPAYVSDIYTYLCEMESKRRPMPDYMEKVQKDVTANMRGVLVDWLVEVSDEYKLLSETLYLAVSYLDRYLSVKAVDRKKLQLVGVTCMLIAAKYEEINPPNVDDFCYITDNSYEKDELVKMEAEVLKALKFEMGNPTTNTFLKRFARIAQENFKTLNVELELLSYFLADLSLLEYSCVKFPPSSVAASVIFLSNFTMWPKVHPWNLKLQKYSGYIPSDLKECVRIIHDLQLSKRGGARPVKFIHIRLLSIIRPFKLIH